ncbi:MAG TPA: DUF6350 family protein [Propionibacteriaceae bacterium]|nr:DUF6350 family protein [Propionibacteriaceae bacterium]
MPSLLSSRRASEITLHAAPARKKPARASRARSVAAPVSWPVVAGVGGLLAALASWMLCLGIAILGWLDGDSAGLSDAAQLGSRFWLLANGFGVRIGTVSVTLVPWGVTAVIALMISRFAAASARRTGGGQTTVGTGLISVIVVGAYLLPVLVVAVRLGEPWQVPGRWAAVVLALLLAAAWGASRNLRGVPAQKHGGRFVMARALVAAQLVVLVAGAALLVISLGTHRERVEALHEALQPGVAGAIALLLLQLAFAPNALVWSASYALGSGFSLGAGSVVAPGGTQLGMVPAIPLLGALPMTGPGDVAQLWWLTAGAISGAIACCLALAGRPALRFDQASLRGGAYGLLAGAVFAGLAWAASGDLGTLRLTDMGPRLVPLLVMACTTMGLSGMITGLAWGLIRRPG